MKRNLFTIAVLAGLAACGEGTLETEGETDESLATESEQAVTCSPQMKVFPVKGPHNIGYDKASCGTGTCQNSCPDQHANSDWAGSAGHHGIDVFAGLRAPLAAVADGTIVAVGWASSSSGLRVRLRDACGWEYYYGHLDSAVVKVGQRVKAGDLVGTMGRTGTSGVHLHFNVSPDGRYSSDINPFNLLVSTSATACAAPPQPPSGGFTPMLRYFNSSISDHFYTVDPIPDGAYGYKFEQWEGQAARTQLAGTVPLHRLWLPGRMHFYTVSLEEVDVAKWCGFTYEGVVAYVLPPDSSYPGAKPVYRYRNGFVEDYFYTVTQIPDGTYGYGYELVAWKTP